MWRLMQGQRLNSRSWDGEQYVLYNNLSGDTHLLDAAAIEMLDVLRHGPLSTAGLAGALQLEAADADLALLQELLEQLCELALVERGDSGGSSPC